MEVRGEGVRERVIAWTLPGEEGGLVGGGWMEGWMGEEKEWGGKVVPVEGAGEDEVVVYS